MAHFAGLVAAGLHPNPVPHCDFVTSTTHKTLAGPRSGFILCREEHAQAVDRAIFPGLQGGPLEHTIAAKAACFKIAGDRRVPRVPDADPAQRRHARRDAAWRAGSTCSPAAPTRTCCSSTCAAPSGRARTPRSGSHEVKLTVNRNTVPFDERPPTVASRRPHRHARRDDARVRRGRLPRDRPVIVGALGDDADLAALRGAQRGALRRAAALPRLPRLDDVRDAVSGR